MLLELLVLIGAFLLFTVPFQVARHIGAGIPGYVLAVCIALSLVIGYEVAAHKAADVLDRRLQGCSKRKKENSLALFYIATVALPLCVVGLASAAGVTLLYLQ